MKILLATDGSACSTAAADFLKRLPLPPVCHVTLLTVWDDVRPMVGAQFEGDSPHPQLDNRNGITQREVDAATRRLEEQAQRLKHGQWRVETLVRKGEPADQIIEVAGELDVDLIVIGSHGWRRVKRFLLGSVSQKVVEYAPCSVLVVRMKKQARDLSDQDTAMSPQAEQPRTFKILLALDGSAPAKGALEMLASLAPWSHIQATIVTVLTVSQFYRMDILEQTTESWQKQKQTAQQELNAAAGALVKTEMEVSVQLREGTNASEEILTIADAEGTDMIMVGHKGHSSVERFLLGSVSSRLVCHASCSVWVHRGSKNRSSSS